MGGKVRKTMKIEKEKLRTLWYEDKDGNVIDCGKECVTPAGAKYQRTMFPNQLTDSILGLVDEQEVQKCRHPRKYVHPTYGWIDGIEGRECKVCHGRQTKKVFKHPIGKLFNFLCPWPKKWDAYGSYRVMEGHATWSEDLVLAMANSGDYTLRESILIAANSCERCMNSLAHKYGIEWGYPEYGEEWQKCGTSCEFCREESREADTAEAALKEGKNNVG